MTNWTCVARGREVEDIPGVIWPVISPEGIVNIKGEGLERKLTFDGWTNEKIQFIWAGIHGDKLSNYV